MKTFALACIIASSAAVSVPSYGGYDEEEGYEHQHIEHGEADRFRDIPIEYEEIEYTIDHKTDVEVRTRQIPVPYLHTETETKY